MNRLRYFFLLCAVIGSMQLQAQTAKQCFLELPDSLLPLLTAVNRADCIDFLDSNMKAEVTNRLGGKSEMIQLTSDYIRLKMSDHSDWQMKLFPLNDSIKVVCVVSSTSAPATDSRICFYDNAWKEQPLARYLPLDVENRDFMQVSLGADELTLKLEFCTPLCYEEESKEQNTLPAPREPLYYVWRDGKFQLVEGIITYQ